MGVRQTESRLPKELGFGAEDLGQVGKLVDPEGLGDHPDCFLISYLSTPLTSGSTNTYVVFVEDKGLREKAGRHKWEVSHNGTPAPPEFTDDGVFEFKPDKIGSIVVTVRILNEDGTEFLRTLEIKQKVQAPNAALEVMLNDPMDRAALGGDPDTTRELVNDLKPYVDAAFKSSAYPGKVPRRLLAAVVYLQIYGTPKFWHPRHRGLELAAEELNDVPLSSFPREIDDALGVCQIRPQTLAMILRNPNSEDGVWDSDISLEDQISEAYPNWREFSYDKEQRAIERKAILKVYNGLAPKTKIDLYNLLRFPKASIRLCFELLTHLKNREHRYPALTTAEFLENTHGIQIIGTEFEIGGVESPLQGEEEIRANWYGKEVLKTVYSPYIALDLGGTLIISGRVTDASTGKPIVGARVDLYETKLKVVEDTLGCFGHYDEILQTAEEYVELRQGDELPVVELLREPPEHPNLDLVRVRKFSDKLSSNEGWVVARSGDNYHAHLLSKREEDVERTDSNGEFAVTVSEFQPFKIRTVRAPIGEDGYFDGETDWIWPPIQDLSISMQPAKHMIRESDLLALLPDWKGYSYAEDWTPKYPDGYYIKQFGIVEAGGNQVACNSFVEALLVEAWYRKFKSQSPTFTWSLPQHDRAALVPNIPKFASVRVYLERMITVTENPNNGEEFIITIGGVTVGSVTVTVNAGASKKATAENIVTALGNSDALVSEVSAQHEYNQKKKRHFVVLKSKNARECDYEITIQSSSGEFAISGTVFPAVEVVFSSSGELPPPWSVVQGYHTTTTGHNFIVVDVHPGTNRALVLESNHPLDDSLNGPGFRLMAASWTLVPDTRPGDIDNHESAGQIDPNRGRHWTDKVAVTWQDILAYYDVMDGTDPVGIARLKVYDLQWSKPVM